jgi:hypothetical protein
MRRLPRSGHHPHPPPRRRMDTHTDSPRDPAKQIHDQQNHQRRSATAHQLTQSHPDRCASRHRRQPPPPTESGHRYFCKAEVCAARSSAPPNRLPDNHFDIHTHASGGVYLQPNCSASTRTRVAMSSRSRMCSTPPSLSRRRAAKLRTQHGTSRYAPTGPKCPRARIAETEDLYDTPTIRSCRIDRLAEAGQGLPDSTTNQ